MMFQAFLVDSENRVKVIGILHPQSVNKGPLPEGNSGN